MDIGKNIRFRRKQLKMTQEQLALEVNSDAGNLSRIERGKQGIPLDKIQLYAQALHCQVSDLIASDNLSKKQHDSLPVGLMRIPVLTHHEAQMWDQIKTKDFALLDREWIVVSSEISKYSFVLIVRDDRNSPDLKQGDVLIIDPSVTPEPGDIVLVESAIKSEAILGKYRYRVDESGEEQFEVYPVNNDFDTLQSSSHKLRIIGVVIEHRRIRSKK